MGASEFEPVSGRCACGAVAYRVDGAATALYHCHCSVCRRLHGSVFVTYACVAREHLTVEAGADRLSTYEGELARWRFCDVCGCHLFAEHDLNPGMAWYMPATLDGDLTPGHPAGSEKHIFVGSKSPLARIPDGVPQFEGHAPDEAGVASPYLLNRSVAVSTEPSRLRPESGTSILDADSNETVAEVILDNAAPKLPSPTKKMRPRR